METVQVNGSFFDVSGRPLKGNITFKARPEYVVNRPEDSIYSGPVVVTLDDLGAISANLIASVGWSYSINFNLRTQENHPVEMRPTIAQFPTSGALPDFLDIQIDAGTTQPILAFHDDQPGEIVVEGATVDPHDPGAIIVPIA